MTAADPIQDLHVIDTDSHWSEPHDLWTSRVPASMVPSSRVRRDTSSTVKSTILPLLKFSNIAGVIFGVSSFCRFLAWDLATGI